MQTKGYSESTRTFMQQFNDLIICFGKVYKLFKNGIHDGCGKQNAFGISMCQKNPVKVSKRMQF